MFIDIDFVYQGEEYTCKYHLEYKTFWIGTYEIGSFEDILEVCKRNE